MKIHALTTGSCARQAQLPVPRQRRATAAATCSCPSAWSEPLPIHCWAIEHEGVLRLVDTGETATARNVPFARFDVTREQELPGAMAAAGLPLDDVLGGGAHARPRRPHRRARPRARARARSTRRSCATLAAPFARVMRRVLRQPLPPGFAPEPFALDGGPFGAFRRSRALSEDGRIVAVPTPGHTPGHISVICVDDDGRHVMLAGDATDSLEQLHALRADAIGPDPKVHVATLETILAHCAQHPTIYLPSHDPESAARLAGAVEAAGVAPAG